MDAPRLDHLRVVTPVVAVVGAIVGLVLAVALVVVLPGAGRADPTVPPLPTPSATGSPTAPPSPTESPSLGPAPSIGPAVQARRTVTRTCRAVVTKIYESTDGGPFRLVGVRRVPTGRLCPARPTGAAGAAASSAPVPTVVASGR